MKLIGIRELKARLSGIVSEVRTGDRVIITDHGQEVAYLAPISEEYRTIQFLCESGKARWSGGKPDGLGREIELTGALLSETILGERQ